MTHESSSRDADLHQIAAEVIRVFWGQEQLVQTQPGDPLTVVLPVSDTHIDVLISTRSGVFTVRSQLSLQGLTSSSELAQMNNEMPAAAYHYVLAQDQVWLQTKLRVPDLQWESIRPPALELAYQAGWNAATAQEAPQWRGPSSYDHFVYIADFLAKAVQEQWVAQEQAHQISQEQQ